MDEEFLRKDTGCLLATRVESSISESTWVFRREMIDRLDVNAVVLQIMRVQQAHFSFFMPAFFLLHASNSGPFCLKKREEGKEKGTSPLVLFGFSSFRLLSKCVHLAAGKFSIFPYFPSAEAVGGAA